MRHFDKGKTFWSNSKFFTRFPPFICLYSQHPRGRRWWCLMSQDCTQMLKHSPFLERYQHWWEMEDGRGPFGGGNRAAWSGVHRKWRPRRSMSWTGIRWALLAKVTVFGPQKMTLRVTTFIVQTFPKYGPYDFYFVWIYYFWPYFNFDEFRAYFGHFPLIK